MFQSTLWNTFIFITWLYNSMYENKHVRRSPAFSGRRGNLNTLNLISNWKSPEKLCFTYKNTTAFFFEFAYFLFIWQKSLDISYYQPVPQNFVGISCSSWGTELHSHTDSELWRNRHSRPASSCTALAPKSHSLCIDFSAFDSCAVENINVCSRKILIQCYRGDKGMEFTNKACSETGERRSA